MLLVTVTPLDAPRPEAAPAPIAPGTATAGAPAQPVRVTSISLYSASPMLVQAPFVMSFASWMGALIGSVLLFLGSRPLLRDGHVGSVLLARTLIPLFASVVAGLVAVLVVASLTGNWTNFWELWAFRWLVTAAAMTIVTAMFNLFSFAAFLLAVPLVFYQALAGGMLAPPATAPQWVAWLGRLPVHDATVGLRTLLIGGPEGTVPWVPVSYLLVGAMVMGWIGTLMWSRRR
ncbi:MAG: hypothetical protein EXQ93_03360 [Alphaproteobacteria bacterium]|nr:hypothetical protein [Alphaproteobacteria bacterium]